MVILAGSPPNEAMLSATHYMKELARVAKELWDRGSRISEEEIYWPGEQDVGQEGQGWQIHLLGLLSRA
jgi:hypothetical protein